jgi:hypothetical protein
MANFLHVLTQKGLDYLIRNNPELRPAIKDELKRRAVKLEAQVQVREREMDGYERDA